MSKGLPVSRLISVDVVLTPLAAQFLNFNSLLIVGDSNVINTADRIRSYDSLAAVATDFGTTAPEYLAADLFFSQVPQPSQLYIGRWAQAATHGLLVCGALTAAQQVMSNWTAITTGAIKIAVDGGSLTNCTGLDFHLQSNLNGVASVIQTAVRALAGAFANVTVTWNSTYNQFTFASGTTGASSAVAALTTPGSGVDITAQLMGTAATLEETVQGIAAESAVTAVTILDQAAQQWYGLMFAAGTNNADFMDSDALAVAAYIQGSSNPHVFGVTTSEAAAITTNDSTSIGYQLKQLAYSRTLYQYSTSSAYAMASFFGRAFTVNFAQNNSTITMMYKQEPGVVAESLTATGADALDSNYYTYYADFNNNTMIIVNAQMASGAFFDEIWGLDWLANQVQTDVYNLLYTSPTKIPQTDAGTHQIVNAIEAACQAGVNNGLLAPGTWNSAGFGQLAQGGYLAKGYYIYAPPVASQAQADREARKSVPIQVAAKLAGAVQTVDITINVNR